MTSEKILMCIGPKALQDFQMEGFLKENIADAKWIKVLTNEEAARKFAKTCRSAVQFWVRSTENICPINLAATIKKDRPDIKVVLVCDSTTGSLLSRARVAGIDTVLNQKEFAKNYYSQKLMYGSGFELRKNERRELNAEGRVANRANRGMGTSSSEEATKEICSPNINAAGKGVFYSKTSACEQDWADSFDFVSGDACIDNIQESFGGHVQEMLHDKQSFREEARRGNAPSLKGERRIRYASNSTASRDGLPENGARGAEGIAMSVVSAGGGSGKSTVAVMTAYYAQSQGLRTVLLDLDGRLGDVQYLTGTSSAISSVDIIKSPEKISQLKCHDGKPALISAPIHAEEAELLTGKYSTIIDLAKKNFDVTIINTSNSWNEELINIMENSSKVLFLTDQRPSSIKATKHALSLCARCGMATTPFTFVLNRCKRKAWFTKEDISFALGGLPVEELQDGGDEVSELLGAGIPGDLLGEPNEFIESLKLLLMEMLPIEADSTSLATNERKMPKLLKFIPFIKSRGVACL